MIKVFTISLLVLAVSFLGVQIFIFWSQQAELNQGLGTVHDKLRKAEDSRNQLKAQLVGYDKPENIEERVRAEFNYRRPDEKMLIIIPPRESATSPHP